MAIGYVDKNSDPANGVYIPDPEGRRNDGSSYAGYDTITSYWPNGEVTHEGLGGAEDNVARLQGRGDERQKRGAWQVANQETAGSRQNQLNAMALLGDAANGSAPSQAENLQRNMVDQSINAQAAAANSMRGGPTAQGSAARRAAFQGAATMQQGGNDIAALRAKEMAEARGQFFGATTAGRGQDIQMAQAQADAEARQRALNDQAEQFYEGTAHDVRKTQVNANLGFQSEANNSAATDRKLRNQENQADWEKTKDIAGIGLGGVTGFSDERAKQDIRSLAYSDERVKKSERLKGQAEGVGAMLKKMAGGGPQPKREIYALSDEAHDQWKQEQEASKGAYAKAAYGNGIYREMPEDVHPTGTEALHREIERSTEGAQPYGSIQAPGVTGSATKIGAAGAPEGYAASRAGKPGDMFSSRPAQPDMGQYTAMQDESLGLAPGTTDFQRATSDARAKENVLMVSDDRAKLAKAWDEGHSAAIANVEKMSRLSPAELKQRSELRPGQTADDESTAAASTARNLKMSAWDEGATEGKRIGAREKQEALSSAIDRQARIDDHQLQPTTSSSRVAAAARRLQSQEPKPEPTAMTSDMVSKDDVASLSGKADAMLAEKTADHEREMAQPSAVEKAAKPGRKDVKKMSDDDLSKWADSLLAEKRTEHEREMAQPAAVNRSSSGLMGRANKELEGIRAEDARRASQPAAVRDPMADANRAMVPSSYSYKPGFESPGQAPGETNVGPMAQNMAADPIARNAVVQDPETGLLALDKEKSLKLVMGSAASLQEQNDAQEARIRELEDSIRRNGGVGRR